VQQAPEDEGKESAGGETKGEELRRVGACDINQFGSLDRKNE